MKIVFDNNIRIAGIGIVPWTRLGPERWLPNYAIASLHSWDLPVDTPGLPPVYALDERGPLPELPKRNTQHLLQIPEFQALLNESLPEFDLITYRPVTIPPALKGRRFIMVDENFTKEYENKVTFREIFKDDVTFPEYTVYDRSELKHSTTFFSQLLNGRSAVVLQDEQLSGGKGTFLVSTYEEYILALESLAILSNHDRVVVSSLVSNARERTIQACVTKQGVLVGQLQRQIVRNPHLANPDIADGDKFCGAQILADDQNTPLHQHAIQVAQHIGARLQAEGYRGIFGIDFLLSDNQTLYTLEINPRITGVTPLLTALYEEGKGIPFYLLHLLELGGYDYEIADSTVRFDDEGGLLVVHSLESDTVTLKALPTSGAYRLNNGMLQFISEEMHLRKIGSDEFILQMYVKPGDSVKAGGRILSVQLPGQIIDKNTDELYNTTVAIIQAIWQAIATK